MLTNSVNLVLLIASYTFSQTSCIQNPNPATVLFENAYAFNRLSDQISAPPNASVLGNSIEENSNAFIADPSATAEIKLQGGRSIRVPGLMSTHTPVAFPTVLWAVTLTSNVGLISIVTGKVAHGMSMHSFTNIRDLGDPIFGLKRGTDLWLPPRLRIRPSSFAERTTSTSVHLYLLTASEWKRKSACEISRH